MTCREFTERLADHLDGTLPRRPEQAMRRHAARCRSCREYLAQYRATVTALRTFGEWDDLEAEDTLDVSGLLAAVPTEPVH